MDSTFSRIWNWKKVMYKSTIWADRFTDDGLKLIVKKPRFKNIIKRYKLIPLSGGLTCILLGILKDHKKTQLI